MLTALSAIASTQAEPTEETMAYCKQFLDYAATRQDAIVTYRISDMVLIVHSDASYFSKPKHAAKQADISSSIWILKTQSTMGLF
jgi:hypothetical protein